MKKRVFGFALVVMMALSMVLMGCDTDTKEDPKVVAEKYQGKWVADVNNAISFTLTKDSCISISGDGSTKNYSAYTEKAELWLDDFMFGEFTSDTEFISTSSIEYTKK